MHLHRGPVAGDEALELAIAHALVRRAGRGEVEETLRVYRPAGPAVVFGRRDTRLPGFPAALRAASDAGFQTAVRAVGGRAVAYTENALVVDHVRPQARAGDGLERRFVEYGALLADALRGLGLDARVGAVPGEYCPGAHSVNARSTVKLVGTAQRVVKDAWLFSSLVTVADHERLADVLEQVYRRLELPFDPSSVGSISGEVPGVQVADVEDAVLVAYGRPAVIAVEDEVLADARALAAQHRVAAWDDDSRAARQV